jgi:hypothetical protein
MGTRRDAKHRGEAHIDQEKSIVDVFEHVIRGVRLNRLREILRERSEEQSHAKDGRAWTNTVEPKPA